MTLEGGRCRKNQVVAVALQALERVYNLCRFITVKNAGRGMAKGFYKNQIFNLILQGFFIFPGFSQCVDAGIDLEPDQKNQ